MQRRNVAWRVAFATVEPSGWTVSCLRRPCPAPPFPCSVVELALGVDARDTGTSRKGGRVGVTTEMEIDVMKGLVLAQHQRIERQRSRMQELERDLRWVSFIFGRPRCQFAQAAFGRCKCQKSPPPLAIWKWFASSHVAHFHATYVADINK